MLHSHVDIFPFLTNTEVEVVSILAVIRIYNAWFMFSFVNWKVSGHTCIPFHANIWFSLDWLSENSSVQHTFQSPVRKLPKMVLTDTDTHIHRRLREEKEWEDVMVRSLPSFPFFLLTWGHNQAKQLMQTFQWWYHPIVHNRKRINVGRNFWYKWNSILFWQYFLYLPYLNLWQRNTYHISTQ